MRNLLAAIDKDLANQWLDGLQLKGLELFGADWSVLTRELKATDRAIRSRRKADKGLIGLGHRQTPQTPPSYDAGSKRHLLADDRGFCKRDNRDDCDRGTECKFRHISHDTAGGPMRTDGEYQQEVAAINARGPPKKMFSMQRSPFQGEDWVK